MSEYETVDEQIYRVLNEVRLSGNFGGTARISTSDDFRKEKFFPVMDVLDGCPAASVGSAYDGEKYYPLAWDGRRHLVTIAPTQTGKSATVLMQTLLTFSGSALVMDIKGELSAVTARRRRNMGQKVFILNPFDVMADEYKARGFDSFARFNPLSVLNTKSPLYAVSVKRICEAIIKDTGHDSHWADSARDLVAARIMYLCENCPPDERTLANVRAFLTLNGDAFDSEIGIMCDEGSKAVRQKSIRFLHATNETSGILSSARTQTDFLDDAALNRCLSVSDFNFLDLKHGKMTIYLVLPAVVVDVYARWFRLLVSSALDALMSTPDKGDAPVLFLLDEFAQLGRMASIEQAMSLAAGYGVQMWPIVQDIHQLKGIYGDRWQTFLSNAGVVQFFTPNDLQTAEYISKRAGVTTRVGHEFSSKAPMNPSKRIRKTPHGELNVIETGAGFNKVLRQSSLLSADDVIDLPRSQQIIFCAGNKAVFKIGRKPYWTVPALQGLYDENPYHKGAPQEESIGVLDGAVSEKDVKNQERVENKSLLRSVFQFVLGVGLVVAAAFAFIAFMTWLN